MQTKSVEKHADLIFDLGLHQGEDTAFYLQKGFRVVAFEADPELVAQCREKFAQEIAAGRLHIVEGAIVANPEEGATITFYKNPTVTVWGTVDPAWRDRNERAGWGSEEIVVPAVDFGRCIEKFGIPYFVKIDIEGADILSLRKLGDYEPRPDFVSIESSKTSLSSIDEELDILEGLGYDAFKAVQQATVPGSMAMRPAKEGETIDYQFPRDASGSFGEESPGQWLSRAQVRKSYQWIFLGYRIFGNDTFVRRNRITRKLWQMLQRLLKRPIPGWFDTHARHASADR